MGAPPGRAAWWSQPPTGPPHPAQGWRSASICQGHRLLRDTSPQELGEVPGRTGREGGQAESGRGGGSRRRALPVRSCPGCLRPTRTSGCRWSGPDGGRGQSDPKGSPPSLPGEAGPRLPADRPPVTVRAAGHRQDHRSRAGPPVTGRAAGQGQVRHAGAATALLPLPPCAAGTDPKAPAPGSRATSFLRPKLPTHAVESTQLPARGALALRRWPTAKL